MENESKVKIKIFGKERTVEIYLVGDNDSERLTKEEESKYVNKTNWFETIVFILGAFGKTGVPTIAGLGILI